MSKVLVDRELLDSAATWLEVHAPGGGCVEGSVAEDLRAILEQPAEAEGVSNARLMNTLAELARRAPLRTLHTICETQHKVSTVKLERYLEPIGDTLAGYAFTLRIDFDKLIAALSAVTAERDALAAARMAYANEFAPNENGDPDVGNVHANIRALKTERDQLRAEVETLRKVIRAALYYVPEHKHDLRELISAAMAAKEA